MPAAVGEKPAAAAPKPKPAAHAAAVAAHRLTTATNEANGHRLAKTQGQMGRNSNNRDQLVSYATMNQSPCEISAKQKPKRVKSARLTLFLSIA